MNFYEILATVAGMIMVVSGVPQIIKIIKNKQAKDVSIEMFFLLFVGQIIWLYYGLHLMNKPLIISNVCALVVSVANITLILRYRNGKNTN